MLSRERSSEMEQIQPHPEHNNSALIQHHASLAALSSGCNVKPAGRGRPA